MYKGLLHLHFLVVTLFLVIYLIKTILLLSNKGDLLATFTKKVKIIEMIISFLFLATGIYLSTNVAFGGKYDYLFYIKVLMVLASIPIAVVGFKKQNKVMAALSLLLITGSFGFAEVYTKKKGIPKDSAIAAATTGESLYQVNCGRCHGDDGKLGLSGAKDISASTLSAEGLKEILLHGKGNMPAFSQLNEEQINLVIGHVQQNIMHVNTPNTTMP